MLADFQTIHPRHLEYDSNITVGVLFPFLNAKCELFDKGNNPLFFGNKTRTTRAIEHFVFDSYVRTGSFWDIINNQVHIFPSLIQDYGLVLSQEETEYYIWNAYTTKSVFIEEPVTTGDAGKTFVFDILGNFTLDPGYGVAGMLTVFVEGPVSARTFFTVSYTVEGQAERDFVITATCTRIIVFPFFPDWEETVKFGMRFETVMATNRALKEQRRPMLAKPQRSVSFTHLDIIRGMTSGALDFAQDKNIGIPVPHEMFTITDIANDHMSVTIRGLTANYWNLKRYTTYVLFYNLVTFEVFAKRIIEVGTNYLSFDTPLLDAVQDVSKIICFPLMIGYFKSATPKVHSGDLTSWELEFEEIIGEDQPPLTGVPALPSTFPLPLDFGSEVKKGQTLYRDIGGFTGTAQAIYAKFPFNKQHPKSLEGSIIMTSPTQLGSFLDFICGAKGRVKTFTFVSPFNEFRMVQPIYAGSNQVKVQTNYFAHGFDKLLNKGMIIKYRGQTLDTVLTGVAENQEFTTLTFNNAISWQIFEEDMDTVRIEKKMTVRLDLDFFAITCLSGNQFKISLRFVEVV